MLCCAAFPQNPTPQQQEVAGRKHSFFKEAVTLQASPGLCQSLRSGQAARHTYSFSPASRSCPLVFCRALIHSS